MVRLELTEHEAGDLAQILEGNLANLRYEIGDTDREGFRNALREREYLIKNLIARLSAQSQAATEERRR